MRNKNRTQKSEDEALSLLLSAKKPTSSPVRWTRTAG
jgi:hypothetical protein